MSIDGIVYGLKFSQVVCDINTREKITMDSVVIPATGLGVLDNDIVYEFDVEKINWSKPCEEIRTAEQNEFLHSKENESFFKEYKLRRAISEAKKMTAEPNMRNVAWFSSVWKLLSYMDAIDYARKLRKYRQIGKNSIVCITMPCERVEKISKLYQEKQMKNYRC